MDRQEEYIQYLYSVIDILKQKLNDSELQCRENSGKLRHSEKICDEKEKFILFQESQLAESEDTICKLKERIAFLAGNKMSTSRARSRSSSSTRSRRRSLSGPEIISLDTLQDPDLLDEIYNGIDELSRYASGARIPHANTIQELADKTKRASELLAERYDSFRENKTREIARLQTANFNLNESLAGRRAREENRSESDTESDTESEDESIGDLRTELENLYEGYSELENIFNEAINNYNNVSAELEQSERNYNDLLAEFEQSERNHDRLVTVLRDRLSGVEEFVAELQEDLELAERRIVERDALLDQANRRIGQYLDERNYTSALYNAEKILTRRLTRQKLLLKMINRRQQIELMNAPVIAPQPINQIWLLL